MVDEAQLRELFKNAWHSPVEGGNLVIFKSSYLSWRLEVLAVFENELVSFFDISIFEGKQRELRFVMLPSTKEIHKCFFTGAFAKCELYLYKSEVSQLSSLIRKAILEADCLGSFSPELLEQGAKLSRLMQHHYAHVNVLDAPSIYALGPW